MSHPDFEGWGALSHIDLMGGQPLPKFPRGTGVIRPMSKRALAKAERLADEALCRLSRLSDMFAIHLDAIEATYPDSFTNERDLLVKIDAEVKRLRAELEGTP